MQRYLIVNFDRYNTENSKQAFVTAPSVKEALWKHALTRENGDEDEDDEEEYMSYVNSSLITVNDTFSCIPGEETDVLVYTIPAE